MKDTELFDLCKQVYEATGWSSEDRGITHVYCHEHVTALPIDWDTSDFHLHIPLYNSDYLMDKLPETITIAVLKDVIHQTSADGNKSYRNRYSAHNLGPIKSGWSDTPLKALLKLCLALKKEGLL